MRIELLPGTTNVVRFPVERRARPTLELLRQIVPDVREVLAIAEGFEMEPPMPDLRDQVDARTAECIASQVPEHAPERDAMLDELETGAVAAAVAACRAAHESSLAMSEAQRTLLRAQTEGGYWLEPLRERAERLTERTAELLLAAVAHADQAEGVGRAVRLARQREAWTPRDHEAEMDILIAARAARRARG